MGKKGVNDFVETTNHMFGISMLLRCLWARKAKSKTISIGKRFKLIIMKLATKITLESFNGAIKLSLN